MDFQFYTYAGLTRVLERAAKAHPDLVTLSSLVDTPEGRRMWCLEIAARKDALPVHRRPGFYVQGNLHSVEQAGCIQCLYLLERLVSGYPEDPCIRRLLDEHVLYIVPRVAVDGAEHEMDTLHLVRSRYIPAREKNVPFPEDLDGNGKILTMRWPSPDGTHRLSDKDPRLLLTRHPGDAEGPFYNTCTEGLLHDWDGGTVRKSRTRNDFNRNFPASWTPFHGWIGHGKYPLSEPETRAVADFLLAHPNIVGVTDFHTGNPAIFYPSAVIKDIAKYPEDADLFRKIGSFGETCTGFQYLSGYSEGWAGTQTERLPGSFKDWLYEHLGLVGLIVEMGMHYNYLGLDDLQRKLPPGEREETDGLAQLAWHDEHPEQHLFFDWRPFDHPQLGPAEIGGWNCVVWANPPLDQMEAVCRRCTEFVLHHAEHRPRLALKTTVTPLGSALYKLAAEIRNTGDLSTGITRQGQETHPFSRPRARIESPGPLEPVLGALDRELDPLPARTGKAHLEWVFRTQAKTLELEIASDRGIYVRETIPLKG